MNTKRILSVLSVLIVLFLAALGGTVMAQEAVVYVQVFEPPVAEDASCEALAELAADTTLSADQMDTVLGALIECTKAPESFEIPSGYMALAPAGALIQGDVAVVMTTTMPVSGTVVSLNMLAPVYMDSSDDTGEVTRVVTDTVVYAQWGATVFQPTQKSLFASYREMLSNGCGDQIDGCKTVFVNLVSEDFSVRRMTKTEIATQFLAGIKAMALPFGG